MSGGDDQAPSRESRGSESPAVVLWSAAARSSAAVAAAAATSGSNASVSYGSPKIEKNTESKTLTWLGSDTSSARAVK